MAEENGYVVVKKPIQNTEDLLVKKEEKVVCEVCGYANDKNALMCKMCSNYIRQGER